MLSAEKIKEQSDSLIDLLTAQCADLEKLLALARQETTAVQSGKFEDVLQIVSERTMVCSRLETFQNQISELREKLGATDAPPLAARIVEVANLTLMQDRETKFLLTAARENFAGELKNLEKSHRGTSAYLRENTKSLAYDRNF